MGWQQELVDKFVGYVARSTAEDREVAKQSADPEVRANAVEHSYRDADGVLWTRHRNIRST